MYKELGFTKVAVSKVTLVEKILGWGKKALNPKSQKKIVDASKGLHDTLKGIVDPWLGAPTKTVKEVIKEPSFGRGLAVGGGVGIVGAMGVNSLFKDKRRNSPYYPS